MIGIPKSPRCSVAFALLASMVAASCGRGAPKAPVTDAVPHPALRTFLSDPLAGISSATLRTNALPWKVIATALVMAEEERSGRSLQLDALPGILTRFGFLYPARVTGWPAAIARPGDDAPVGLLRAMVRGPLPGIRIEGATLGCASCHSGVTYDATGHPTRIAWPGLPNTSLNVDAYVSAAYRGLQRADADPAAFRRRLLALFDDLPLAERLTLRYVLQPAIRRRLAELRRMGDRPTPFSNGGPGRTNGVAALQRQLGLLGDGVLARHAVGFTSIPDLSGRELRRSLLYDGVYAPRQQRPFGVLTPDVVTERHVDSLAAVVAFFTVPTMGVAPDVAAMVIPRAQSIMRWLATEYRPPPFPGRIDSGRARAGARLFEAGCASCHGRYDPATTPRRLEWFPNLLVPQAEIGTDPARWTMVDSTFIAAVDRTAFGRHMTTRRTGGYVAPILSAVWATAPYLHNGSVPTLWALLSPEARPRVFPVGGHRLDFDDVGIDLAVGRDGSASYPPGYVPWSTPELYDTREPGLSNLGHERYSAHLTDAEKRAVIEYLKLL